MDGMRYLLHNYYSLQNKVNYNNAAFSAKCGYMSLGMKRVLNCRLRNGMLCQLRRRRCLAITIAKS